PGSHTFPASTASLDKSLYGCADQLRATIFDSGTTAGAVAGNAVFEGVNRLGVVVDTEHSIGFSASGTDTYASAAVPVPESNPAACAAVPGRESSPAAAADNGARGTAGAAPDEPYSVRVRYTDSPRSPSASARISCQPYLVAWRTQADGTNWNQQAVVSGGCDQ